MFFGIRNFGDIAAMRAIFFLKSSKCYVYFKNAEKNWENGFSFLDNGIWTGRVDLSLLRRENLWPAVNVFTNSLKVLPITKRDFFQLSCLHINQ